jgi:hypothetical protein
MKHIATSKWWIRYGSTARVSKRTLKDSGGGLFFYILISNTDDHLRNLGFLYDGSEAGGLLRRTI